MLQRCKSSLSRKVVASCKTALWCAGFNINLTPGFSPARLAFMLGYGGILAVANLRSPLFCDYIRPLWFTSDAKHCNICCFPCLWHTVVQLRLKCSICYTPSTFIAHAVRKRRLLSKVSDTTHATMQSDDDSSKFDQHLPLNMHL